MKPIRHTTGWLMAFCLVSGTTAFAQDEPAPVSPAPARPFVGQAGGGASTQPTTNNADKLARQLADQKSKDLKAAELRVLAQHYTWNRSGTESRPLVVRTSDTDPKTLAAMEEDLNIMGRILEKAARVSADAEPAEAMGVPLVTMPSGGGAKNIQIEGYGAVFELAVGFPLRGPAEKADDKTPKEPTNSAWDQTKRELYGQPARPGYSTHGTTGPQMAFDPKRVDRLKEALLVALKNASNMSHLKSDENVTVVVTSAGLPGRWAAATPFLKMDQGVGRSAGGFGGTAGGGGGAGESGGGTAGGRSAAVGGIQSAVIDDRTSNVIYSIKQPDGSSRVLVERLNADTTESVLTIRAKKSDIDAFAKGKLSQDEFRGKATVLLY